LQNLDNKTQNDKNPGGKIYVRIKVEIV
jgi:hypothetical protein